MFLVSFAGDFNGLALNVAPIGPRNNTKLALHQVSKDSLLILHKSWVFLAVDLRNFVEFHTVPLSTDTRYCLASWTNARNSHYPYIVT